MKPFFQSLLLLLILSAVPAAAYDIGGTNLLIPIAGRTPGAHGTQWRTDLVITNLEDTAVPIHVTFQPTTSSFVSRTLPANGTLVFDDVILETMMTDGTTGMLRIHSAWGDARFIARAYVYNTGNASGEYGQGITAVDVDALGPEHSLSGLVGTGGRRTNVGIANPWPSETDVILILHGTEGEILAQDARTIPALNVLQLNDIFGSLGIAPTSGASLRIYSSLGVYPYASVVRNDTGDAVFVPGSGLRVSTPELPVMCAEPAALIMPYRNEQPQEESVVILDSPDHLDYVINHLAPWHQFMILETYDEIGAFRARLTPEQIAVLRCESVVQVVRRDGLVPEP